MDWFGLQTSYEAMPGIERYLGVNEPIDVRRTRKAFFIDLQMTVARNFDPETDDDQPSLELDAALWANKLECTLDELVFLLDRLKKFGFIVVRKRGDSIRVTVPKQLHYMDEATKKKLRRRRKNVRTVGGQCPDQRKPKQTKPKESKQNAATARDKGADAPETATPPSGPGGAPPPLPDPVGGGAAVFDASGDRPSAQVPEHATAGHVEAGGGSAEFSTEGQSLPKASTETEARGGGAPPGPEGGVSALAPTVRAVVDELATRGEAHAFLSEHAGELSETELAYATERYERLCASEDLPVVADPAKPFNAAMERLIEEGEPGRRAEAAARVIQEYLQRAEGATRIKDDPGRLRKTRDFIRAVGIDRVAEIARQVIRDRAKPDHGMRSTVGVFQARCEDKLQLTAGKGAR